MTDQNKEKPILSAEAIVYYWDRCSDFVEDNIIYPARKFIPSLNPTKHQKEAMDAISKHNRVAIESGHGTGKSTVFCWIVLWFLCTRGNTLGHLVKTPCIAPTYHQLQDILWPEFRRWIPRSRLNSLLQVQKNEVWWNGQKDGVFARARTALKSDHVQGFHGTHLLWIADEAFGITNNEIWETIEGSITEEDNKILIGGQHTVLVGYVHDAFHRDRAFWKALRFNSEESPLAKKEYAERIARKYGRDSDIFIVRVLGGEPKGNPNAFIQLSDVMAATMREVEQNIGPLRMGVDPARFGDDSTVLTLAKGNHVFPQKAKGKTNTDDIVDMVKSSLEEYRNTTGDQSTCEVNIDLTGGYGAGPYDALKKEEVNLNVRVHAVLFKGKMTDKEYYDGVSIMWGEFRDVLQRLHLPDEDSLVEEVSSRRFTIVADDKIKIESKEDFKKEYGASPDRADSIVVCFTNKARIKNVIQSKGTLATNDFKVDFDDLSEFSTLICSIWVDRNMSTSIIYGLWNARQVTMWIFGELLLDHPRPDRMIVESSNYLRKITDGKIRNINKFQVWGSPTMHSTTEKEALNDVATAYQKFNVVVRENDFLEEFGAIALLSRLIQRGGLKIHSRCKDLGRECIHWTTSKGKPDAGFGFARSLCNAVSACWETTRHDPMPKPIKPFSKESQENRRVLETLIKTNPDGFDTMTDEEIGAFGEVAKMDDGAGWIS